MRKIKVVVCGLPSSGNRVFKSIVNRMIAATPDVEGDAEVWHGYEGKPPSLERHNEFYGLIPYRLPRFRALSLKARNLTDHDIEMSVHGRQAFLHGNRIRTRYHSYEDLVAHTSYVCGEISSTMNLTSDIPWIHEAILPADRPIYDGNAKYVTG